MTGFLPLSLPPPLVGLSSASPLLSPPRSPISPFKSRAREVALFLELVLLLLLGSTCRYHHGVFVPRIPRATLATLGPWPCEKTLTRMRTRSNCEFTLSKLSRIDRLDRRDQYRSQIYSGLSHGRDAAPGRKSNWNAVNLLCISFTYLHKANGVQCSRIQDLYARDVILLPSSWPKSI